MKYPKIALAQSVVAHCKLKGIRTIVLSPGSRNAPLTIGFSNDPYFNTYALVDERCAGFFALGLAQQLGVPTALVCTSGSALLNYYPAVAEAYYSRIPLVILSADRPLRLLDIGDGQTIRQANVYQNHILYSTSLGTSMDTASTQLHRALNTALEKQGPVHVNVPFEEPLYETVTQPIVTPSNIPPAKFKTAISKTCIESCLEQWQGAARKLILVGCNTPNRVATTWLNHLAKDPSVIVMTERTSNIEHPAFFSHIDALIAPLTPEEILQLQPDILLSFGGLIVSKKIKTLLRTHPPKAHWHIDLHDARDTFFVLKKHIKTTPNVFFKTFLPHTHPVPSSYRETWTSIKTTRLKCHETYLQAAPFSDLKVFEHLAMSLPQEIVLQVGNSSAIRYLQLFNIHPSIAVYCNRGTSGIEGSTSTAVGCAVAARQQTIFITGDLSFFYDSNALWNNYIPKSFRIILINNSGGGIFRILPGDKDTENFDTFFETTHHLNAESICQMHGFHYFKADNEQALKTVLRTFYNDGETPRLLEIFTPRQKNDTVLLNYFEALTPNKQ